jgi:superfamily II DNA or RNA helicase/intein/homing endonuclease
LVAPTGCLSGDTIIRINRAKKGGQITLAHLYLYQNNLSKQGGSKYDLTIPTKVRSFNEETIQLQEINSVSFSGRKQVFTITLLNGKSITATPEHKFLTPYGWEELQNLTCNDFLMCDAPNAKKGGREKVKYNDSNKYDLWFHPYARVFKTKDLKTYKRGYSKSIEIHRCIYEANINRLSLNDYLYIVRHDEKKSKNLIYLDPKKYHIHHKDGNHYNNHIKNLEAMLIPLHKKEHAKKNKGNFNQGIPEFSQVIKIEDAGIQDTYDIYCNEYHNFSANDIVAHNSGKTVIAAGIISCYPNHKILFLCHTISLLKQTTTEFTGYFTEHTITQIGDGNKDLSGDIVISTIQSFSKISVDERDLFDVIIVDECFAKGTKISTASGEKKIEDIKVNDFIFSSSGANKVKNIFKTKVSLDRVIRVTLSSDKIIYCSKEHLFKVGNNWIQAKNLDKKILVDIFDVSNIMMSNIIPYKELLHENKETKCFKILSYLWKGVQIKKQMLFKRMSAQSIFCNHEKNQFRKARYNSRSNEKEQPFIRPEKYRERETNKENKWYVTCLVGRAWREWKAYSATNTFSYCFGLGNRSGYMDRAYPRRKKYWFSSLLQSGYRKQRIDVRNRSRWEGPPVKEEYRKRQKEGNKIKRTRVESVEIYQRGSNDESFKSIIGDKERNQGYVEFYDLEVGNDHNYFVEGVLVHNCHHLCKEDSQYYSVLTTMTAPIRLGLTATLPTSKEGQLILEGLIGEVIGETTLAEGIELDFLSVPKVKLIPVPNNNEVRDLRQYNEIYDAVITNNRARNRLVLQEIRDLNERGLTTLTFVSKIEQGNNLVEIAKTLNLPITFIQGSTEGEDRELYRIALHEKKIMNVIATTVFKEGINVKSLNAIIIAGGGKSELALLQTIGRGLRRDEGKSEVLIVDFVDCSRYISEHFCERLKIYTEKNWVKCI